MRSFAIVPIFLLVSTALICQLPSSGHEDRDLSDKGASPVARYSRNLQGVPSDTFQFDERLAPFYHGVASGDPMPDRVILWTRVTPAADGVIDVTWRIATDTGLVNVVTSGATTTDQSKDYTVKVDAIGLAPSTTYYYGFRALDRSSLTGRTKTAPAGAVDRLRFAVASCANYQAGYFNAYAHIAERNDLDAVIFLGDYIYEHEEGGYGYNDTVGRGYEPDHEIVSLSDYRIRHSFYKLDPDLRRLHQQLPFIPIWDDHETANNAWRDGATNHQPATEGDWNTRKQSSMKAYYEWMPVRMSGPDPMPIHRTLSYGNLAELILLDTRLEGRDKQVDTITSPEITDTTRTILGAAQYEWLLEKLHTTSARWRILGNQVVMAQVKGFPNVDAWDGYPAERDRLFRDFERTGLENVVVLTGDVHSSSGGDLLRNPYDPSLYNPVTGKGSLAVEFVTPSITAGNLNEIYNLPPRSVQSLLAEASLHSANPHLKYIELDSHGYIVLDLTDSAAQGDWYYADTILVRKKGEHFASGWRTGDGQNFLLPASAARLDRPGAPAPAPIYPPGQPSSITTEHGTSGLLVVGNYPNPVEQQTLINYVLAKPGSVTIEVFDANGRSIATPVVRQPHEPGIYSLLFDAKELPNGSYFYRIHTGVSSVTRSMVVRR